MTQATASPLGFRQVLEIIPFRRLWLAQAVSIFGDFLAVFAVFSLATFRFHASASEISLIIVAYLAPLALVSPLSGALVDRWQFKHTMIISDLVRAALAFLLVFATDLRQIYAIFFALATVSSFFTPAQSVAYRTLVPPEGLLSANALMSQAAQITQILTPAIAGFLVDFAGPEFSFYFDVASFLFSAWMISGISIQRKDGQVRRIREVGQVMADGLRFILTHQSISFVIIAMTVGMFAIRSFSALLAVYVRDVLHSSSTVFGVLNSMIGIGMIVATQFMHRTAKKRPPATLVNIGLLVAGAFIGVLAAFGTIPTTFLGMFGLGFGVAFVFIPAQTLLQTATPMPMMARVTASLVSALAFTQAIALLASGAAAEWFGIRNLYFVSAALLVFLSVLGYRRLVPAADKASQP